MKITIIGAGLAGTALGYTLKQAGLNPDIYEAGTQIAAGASGNETGLINPRFSAHRSPDSDYFTSAFSLAIRTFETLQQTQDIGWKKCGSLHLMADEKKQKRFPQTIENWGWPEENLQILNAQKASDIAGIEINHNCLHLPDSGIVSPQKLCSIYAQELNIHLGSKIKNLNDLKSDIIILACGYSILNFEEAKDLPLQTVRGQITKIKATDRSKKIKTNLCYGGYCAPATNGAHTLGATFQRWLDHADIIAQDDQDNIQNLQQSVPALAEEKFEILDHRASLRTTSKDHFPLVGKLPGHDNIYVSTGHGSHGILSSLAAAHLITDIITGQPRSQSRFTVNALCPSRFLTIQ